ncbi:MAG TPA: S9 family peptidase [Candidatus Limnocylindrales bacterium]
MKPTDLAHLQVPDSVSLSPDARTVVFALRTVDLAKDAYHSRLWRVPADGSAPPTQLTRGDRDTDPQISPDQRWVAFRRAVNGEPSQLYVMPLDGGEPWAITTRERHPIGVGVPVWSPDSTRIAYTARVPEHGRYGTALDPEGDGYTLDKERRPEKELPRRVKVWRYRFDDVGYLIDRRPHIFTIEPLATEPKPRQLTEGDFDHNSVSWSPDGRSLAFISARHDERDTTLTNDVFVIDASDGGEPRQLTDTTLSCDFPIFSRDGSLVYFAGRDLGESGRDWFARHTGAWVIPLDGSGPARRLSDPDVYTLDVYFGPGRDGVLYTNHNRGAVELLEFTASSNSNSSGEPRAVITGNRWVTPACTDAAGDAVAAVAADQSSFGEVVVVDAAGERVLTSYGKQWAETTTTYPMEELEASAPDGYPVHGWLVKPEGPGPHPVLLMIHGGPFAQYGWKLFDEAQAYAGAGYAVVYGNPRGSSGYGYQHGKYIEGDVGVRSAPDLYALLHHALKDPSLDGTRLGVLGGSHGGFMTSWLVGNGDRFRAAVSERAVNAIDSFIGTSDVGWIFGGVYGWDTETHAQQSPLTHAANVRTPVLIIHSENDFRCPLEQAQRYYHALKWRGVPTEMLLFPGEGHEMSRTGLPSHRIARFEAILDWFNRYL